MDLKEIMAKKRTGDYDLAVEMTGLGKDNVRKSLQRVGSKHHATVVKAFTRIIANREALLANVKVAGTPPKSNEI